MYQEDAKMIKMVDLGELVTIGDSNERIITRKKQLNVLPLDERN